MYNGHEQSYAAKPNAFIAVSTLMRRRVFRYFIDRTIMFQMQVVQGGT
jgi:hypothetical protein